MKLYIIEAFTDKLFSGNPAGVCILDEWPPRELMQNIAMENNQAETTFVVRKNGNFHIRWFTPAVEVDLCGHATLAAAHVLFNHEHYSGDKLVFDSRSGKLTVTKGEYLTLDFPVDTFTKQNGVPKEIQDGFRLTPLEVWKGKTDYMAVFGSQAQIESLDPDFNILARLDARGVIATAPGAGVDFVSRFFAPQCGINEDPVTGSAHTTLMPYWAKRLNKSTCSCLQLSKRGGRLHCALKGDRVHISGQAKTYLIGSILNH